MKSKLIALWASTLFFSGASLAHASDWSVRCSQVLNGNTKNSVNVVRSVDLLLKTDHDKYTGKPLLRFEAISFEHTPIQSRYDKAKKHLQDQETDYNLDDPRFPAEIVDMETFRQIEKTPAGTYAGFQDDSRTIQIRGFDDTYYTNQGLAQSGDIFVNHYTHIKASYDRSTQVLNYVVEYTEDDWLSWIHPWTKFNVFSFSAHCSEVQ